MTAAIEDSAEAFLASLPAERVAGHARMVHRFAREAEARTVYLAYRIGLAVFDEFSRPRRCPTHTHGRRITDAAMKAAIGEISLQLKVSRSQAARWVALADLLVDLPLVRRSFLNGEHSLARITLIAHALMLLDAEVRDGAQAVALDLAERYTADRTLRDQLDELVISLDPDKAVDARDDFAERHQNVVITGDAHGHATIAATVPAEHGVLLAKQIAALIDARICIDDPRPIGRQRVAALAELHGLPQAHLRCACGRADCPKNTTPPSESTTPEPATEDAGSDTGLVVPSLTVFTDPAGIAVPHLLGHGALDAAHAADIVDTGLGQPYPLTIDTTGLVVAGTEVAPIIDPAGHGGLTRPPPGALRYRPSPRLRAQIIATDKICRYPLCGRPADECELDHLVPFDPDHPELGGWTIAANLIPLCTPDHHRKHLGLWIPTMHADRCISWHNPRTGQTIITRPR
ncbi:HNH endonuclease [Gordonia sp. ABSL1-1]|uniref:HNH endonuclease signature motif containing protein n=1 Tax=Gordonia sp. ABSL1-1 TaxID=3053923 RepID=UPI00257473DA|nr:HNH endonuclease signature motif containing protein [Gordonia sp. ABSL1-1]MDL9935995.1 HNH endonuclease [Gordonia sp. ABSL1-1]